jgi:hypothetical protein
MALASAAAGTYRGASGTVWRVSGIEIYVPSFFTIRGPAQTRSSRMGAYRVTLTVQAAGLYHELGMLLIFVPVPALEKLVRGDGVDGTSSAAMACSKVIGGEVGDIEIAGGTGSNGGRSSSVFFTRAD